MVGPDNESEARNVYRDMIVVYNASTGTTLIMTLANGSAAWTGTYQRAVRVDSATFVPVMRRRPAARAQPKATIDPWMPRAPAPIRAAAWPVQIRRFRGNSGSW